MSKIEELIRKLCPDGVEYRKITEIATVTIGEFVHKNKQNNNSRYPVYNGGITNTGFYDEYNNDGKKILISARGANAGYVNKINGRYWAGNSCYTITIENEEIISWKFLYYYLKNNESNILGQQQTGSIPAISKKQIECYKVAIPPIEVQNEIVRILDNFTELEAELEAELEVRKKQYEHYRDEVFRFKNNKNVEYKKLGKIATISRGGNFQKKDFVSNGFPCIHYGQIYTKYGLYANKVTTFISESTAKKSKIAKPNDIIMAVTSENVEDVCKCVAWVGKENIAVSGHTAIIHSELNAKYLSYYFHTNMFYTQKLKYVHGTKVIEFTPKNLENIEIPIVSNEEQEKIVSILDRFDKLCNDISDGLPAELEARRKQYEYYRDKLLNFKELKVENKE